MFLSFIVPVYNTAKYLEECLDSLLAQDIASEDYEIICVDDGSTDNSLPILNHYGAQHKNITIVNKKNGGVASARNTGLDLARGDYIWFVDSDDFIQKNVLSGLKKLSQQDNYDRIVIGMYSFHEKLTPEEQQQKDAFTISVNSNRYDSVVWSSLLNRAYLQKHHLRFNYPNVSHGEDIIFMYEFNLHMPKKTSIDEPLYFYRNRENSAMTSKSKESQKKKQLSYLQNVIIMKEYYDKKLGDPITTANTLMTFLWLELFELADMPIKAAAPYMQQLKKEKLYPFVRPQSCTLMKSYQTTRTDLVGKIFELIYLNMHRRVGFWAMRLWKKATTIKNFS